MGRVIPVRLLIVILLSAMAGCAASAPAPREPAPRPTNDVVAELRRHVEKGENDAAITLLDQALASRSSSPAGAAEVRYLVAEAYLQRSVQSAGNASIADAQRGGELLERAAKDLTPTGPTKATPLVMQVFHRLAGCRATAGDSSGAIETLETLRREFTLSDVGRAQTLHALGDYYFARGAATPNVSAAVETAPDDFAVAEKCQREALEAAGTGKATAVLRGYILLSLAQELERRAQVDDAIKLYEQARHALTANEDAGVAPSVRDTLEAARYAEANLLLYAARYDEAQKVADETDKSSPRGQAVRGMVALQAGNLTQATGHLDAAIAACELRGAASRDADLLLNIKVSRAECAIQSYDLRRAEELITSILSMAGDAAVPALQRAGIQLQAARLYLAMHRLKEAHDLLDKAWAVQDELLPADHPDRFATLLTRAALAQEEQDLASAETWARQAVAGLTKALGEDALAVGQARIQLANILLEAGHCADALKEMSAGLVVTEKVLGADHPNVVETRLQRLWVAAKCADDPAAKAVIAELLPQADVLVAKLAERLGPKQRRVLLARETVIDARAEVDPNAADAAIGLYEQLEKDWPFEPCHPDTLSLRLKWGRLLVARGRQAEAERLVRETLDECRQRSSDNPQYGWLCELYGSLLESAGDEAGANDWYRQAYETLRNSYPDDHPAIKALRARL